MTHDVSKIADGLSEARQAALMWLPSDGLLSPTRAYWKHAPTLGYFSRELFLVEKIVVGKNGPANECRWKLTPLGLAVRDELLRREVNTND